MAKKDAKKSKNFKLDDKGYSASLAEARTQEMESILPGFYTNCEGRIIKSKPITSFNNK